MTGPTSGRQDGRKLCITARLVYTVLDARLAPRAPPPSVASARTGPTFISVYSTARSARIAPWSRPDSDERDNLIKQKSIQVSIISIGVLLVIASVAPWLFVGLSGSIPVFFLPFINLGVSLIAFIVYNVAVLIQYGRGGKDIKK